MYNRIYVRNRQTLRGYRYKLTGKPYSVKLKPYDQKSLEWHAIYYGASRKMLEKTDGVIEVERYQDKDGLYVILQPFKITGYSE